jgi:hypothetical protein
MNRLRITLLALLIALPAVPLNSTQAAKDKFPKAKPIVLNVTCDRENAIYGQGDKVIFRVVSSADGEAAYRLSEDGFKTIKFKGKSLHSVRFIDTVCAPTTVYAAYNVHPEPKTMINNPRMGHAGDPAFFKALGEFWKKNLPLKPPSKAD